MTKSDQKAVSTPKNNIDADDKKSHFMSQLMEERRERDVEIAGLMDALRKIGYFQSFHAKDNHSLSGDKLIKTHKRVLKNHNKARYRKIKKYYKSVDKYKKERLRRKLCWLLSGTLTYPQIADMLHISRRTVIRDINKIRPYYERMFRSYIYQLEVEQWREAKAKMEGMSLSQQFNFLTNILVERRDRMKVRDYKSHFTILRLDMTKTDKYGIPQLSIKQKGRIMGYPHKVSVQVIGNYEGKSYLAKLGGFTITQTTGRGW